MDSTNSEYLAQAVVKAACGELDEALGRIEHCVKQLSDDELWWRPANDMNSVANLMLHLSGNLRQWIVAGLGNRADTRRRAEEFAARGPRPRREVWGPLHDAVQVAKATLQTLNSEDFASDKRIQGFGVTGVQACLESVAHFRGHTQEIIHLTRTQLGDRYQYAWVPTSPEHQA